MNPHKLLPTLSSITTSDQWYTYYKANAEFQLEIPWKRGAEITEDESAIDGLHLLAAAKNYAQYIKHPKYVDVIELFIKEQQRHRGDLVQFCVKA